MPYYIKQGPPVGLRVPLGPYYATGQDIFGPRLYGLEGLQQGLGLLWIPLIAGAAASGLVTYIALTPEEIEDLWRDSDTFNDKARRINAVWEGINDALSKCQGAWNDRAVRIPFREAWLKGWAPWYDSEGDRVFDASVSDVQQLRDYLIEVNKWAVKVGDSIRRNCQDQFETYPYRKLNDIGLDPNRGTITDQQKTKLEEALRAAEISKVQESAQNQETQRWEGILKGVGWVLVGGITLATVAFGYRIYSDVRRKR